MINIDVYRVLDQKPSMRCVWLLRRGQLRLGRILWRLENPQGRWQAEWDGCQKAPRALTQRGALRKALKEVSGER